jgi:hypothetical protein
MFSLLIQTRQMLQASFMGGEGVDGGQGDADHVYGMVESEWAREAAGLFESYISYYIITF